jgi:hypothetical protein
MHLLTWLVLLLPGFASLLVEEIDGVFFGVANSKGDAFACLMLQRH